MGLKRSDFLSMAKFRKPCQKTDDIDHMVTVYWIF